MLNILYKKIATFIYLSANIDGDISSMLEGREGGIKSTKRGRSLYKFNGEEGDNIER